MGNQAVHGILMNAAPFPDRQALVQICICCGDPVKRTSD